MMSNIEEYTKEDLLEQLKEFVAEHIPDKLLLMLKHPDQVASFGLEINFLDLTQEYMHIGAFVLSHPKTMLALFDEAIGIVQDEILSLQGEGEAEWGELTKKTKFHARISNLPANKETTKSVLPRASDIGKLIAVRGTVIRTEPIKMVESKKIYKCNTCGWEFERKANIESVDPFPFPTTCTSASIPACNGRKFSIIQPQQIECLDYQEIKIQEQVHVLGVGSIPRSIVVVLMEDLVDVVKPGDDVTITGEVTRKWKNFRIDERVDVEIILNANHIRINNEQKFGVNVTEELKKEFMEYWKKAKKPLVGRDHILRSLCPEMYGMYVVKMAIALVLAGGVRSDIEGHSVRGESHILLVGDPGMGKSQILKYAAKIANRSVLTTGIGTTTAGLTVTAVKEKGGDWILEAGALVLADGGICCIDEFDSIQEKDKTSIHEAMEQQSLSVAKAGLICKLKTRCSVIAALNPKGCKYDTEESLAVNTALASPLLSRFDLAIVMLDQQDKDWDMTVSNFILKEQQYSDKFQERWSMEKLQAYFSYIRTTFFPELTEEATTVLQEYYKKQRVNDSRNAARTTIRLLESLIRLAQAHARMMHRNIVLLQDALVAILLMESSMATSAILGFENAVRSTFPEDPEAVYKEQEEGILHALNLDHLIPAYEEEQGGDEGGDGGSVVEQEEGEKDEVNVSNDGELRSQYSQLLHNKLKETMEKEREKQKKVEEEKERVAAFDEETLQRLENDRAKREEKKSKQKASETPSPKPKGGKANESSDEMNAFKKKPMLLKKKLFTESSTQSEPPKASPKKLIPQTPTQSSQAKSYSQPFITPQNLSTQTPTPSTTTTKEPTNFKKPLFASSQKSQLADKSTDKPTDTVPPAAVPQLPEEPPKKPSPKIPTSIPTTKPTPKLSNLAQLKAKTTTKAPSQKPASQPPQPSQKPASQPPQPSSQKLASQPSSQKPASQPPSQKPASQPSSQKPASQPSSQKPASQPPQEDIPIEDIDIEDLGLEELLAGIGSQSSQTTTKRSREEDKTKTTTKVQKTTPQQTPSKTDNNDDGFDFEEEEGMDVPIKRFF
eukprot:TRINITY_DN6905_c0_g1_i9.p1 TRINITY_DN6905_c0_g1~~TRINITY_DN6905_c0_g1_i9.p1  ORF type:complete len:1068 (-),score=370.46 TRINITY_DN6905_c0_g1_i9:42-3245(-)